MCHFTIGSLRCHNSDGNVNIKNAIGLIKKTTTLHVQHAFLYISSPSLHDYNLESPGFTFYGGRKHTMTNFSFSFLYLEMVVRNLTPGDIAYNCQILIAMKFERTQIHFIGDIFSTVVIMVSLTPYYWLTSDSAPQAAFFHLILEREHLKYR